MAAQSTCGGFGHEAGTSQTDPAPLFKRAWGDQHADELVVVVVVVVVGGVVVGLVVVVLAIVGIRHIRCVPQSVPLLLTYVHACSRAILVHACSRAILGPTHAHPIIGVVAGDFGRRSSAGHSRLHAITHVAIRAARHVGGRVGGGRRLGRCSTAQAGVNEAQHEHLAQRR